MSLAYMGAPSRTAPCRGPELVSYRRDPAPQIGVFYTNFGNMHCPAASTGRAPDHRDRCWVRLLLCAKVLTESDQALGREGRIADPHRQEPDVNGNPTTPQIGGFYANFGSMRRPAASTGRAPDHRDRCWVRLLFCAKVLTESNQALGRDGRIADPHRQEPDVVGNPTTPQIGGFYANFKSMRRQAASIGRAPDHRDRCWVRLLLCAKVLTESDQALGREGRIADPHRQEPDVIGNPTTTRRDRARPSRRRGGSRLRRPQRPQTSEDR